MLNASLEISFDDCAFCGFEGYDTAISYGLVGLNFSFISYYYMQSTREGRDKFWFNLVLYIRLLADSCSNVKWVLWQANLSFLLSEQRSFWHFCEGIFWKDK